MAVPKKKTSKSRKGMRRSHHALSKVNVVIDSNTGEYKLPHHVCMTDGTYNNREIIVAKDTNSDTDQ